MPPRLRKLIGMIVLVILVMVYSVLSVAIATVHLPPDNGWAHLAFFGLSGLLWVVPAMVIIKWMIGKKEDYEEA